MTKRELIAANRSAILALGKRFGALDIQLIGSVARGDDRPDSDIDFLVTMHPERSLLARAGLKVELEDLLGCPVDVANAEGVKARFLANISSDLQSI